MTTSEITECEKRFSPPPWDPKSQLIGVQLGLDQSNQSRANAETNCPPNRRIIRRDDEANQTWKKFDLALQGREFLKSILLWLFVINLGIALGAGLYETRVVIPQWANLPPKDWPNTGLLFWAYVTTVPLTLLALANLSLLG